MTVKSSGTISLTDLTAEFGGGNPISISQFYRGGARVPSGPVANANIPTSGTVSLSQFYGSMKELTITLTASTTNYNFFAALQSAYGTISSAVTARLIINSGVIVGSTNAQSYNALSIGQFPAGSVITLINNGSIQGGGGFGGPYYATGSYGGTAINANYNNQTLNITNTGHIYGGGGGGGAGGWSGAGGTGGQGYYGSTEGPYYTTPPGGSFWLYSPGSTGNLWIKWNNVDVINSGFTSPENVTTYGQYTRGALQTISGSKPVFYYHAITKSSTTYTSGGAGGVNVAGGAGGRGYGYDGANAAGAAGAAPVAGAAGGVNAGAGGSSGTGGTGGTGGGWGASGSAGGTGTTGSTGASGNYTAGSAGTAGGGGAAGGLGGHYVYFGNGTSGNVVNFVSNTGSVAGYYGYAW